MATPTRQTSLPLVHGAEMRVAETRAVNRALRKAYGIGLCSVEELGWSPRPSGPDRSHQNAPPANGNNGHQNGQPRLRDQLCLLIRKHQLDAGLVKAYAADYCGTPALRDASKAQIESFITHLADWAVRDRDALLCKLNSYATIAGGAPMKRYVPGLHGARQNADDRSRRPLPGSGRACLLPLASAEALLHPVPDVLEPKEYAGRTISGRLYSTPRALWKLSWFLRDFGYDTDLLGRDEVDEKALRGLRGVVRISRHRAQRSPLPQP